MANPSLVQRIAARHVASMPRTACIVAAGTFGDSYCLLKNRDRNYVPEIRVVHEVKDGVEVAYLEDEFTGWVEGLNEYGVGIVNAALMVSRDETERDAVERTGKKLGDGERILKALTQETVAKAAKSIREFKGGLKGHTIISDGKKSYYVEMPDSNDLEYDDLPLDKLFVRTNHGVEFSDAGYVEGEREKSSKSRQEEAEEVLSEVNSPDDIAPALLKAREERWEPTEMVRDGRSPENMRTTTQMVLDLTEKKLLLYLLPDKVKWLGLDDRMPEGRKAKIEVQVLEYKDLSIKTDGDVKFVKKGSDGLLPILDPAFNVREMFKQLVLLEDHLFHPRKRCPDCIWKHLFTTEALAEEAVTLDVDQQYTSLLGGLADQIRRVQRAVQEGLPFEFIAQKVREVRKGLLSVASQVRVASGKQAAYFNVGDYITYGKFQNKPGKLVRIFTDERGIPMIEIEPVPKGRKKNRVMGLFRVRHVTPPEEKVASRWLTRTAAVPPEEMALEFLTDLGIHAHIKHGVLLVDRTSMVEFSPRLEEGRAYEAVLTGLKAEFPDYRIYWGGRTDDWMGVEFHPKAGHGKTAEGKYKEKKKVPKADGSGTTTVYVYGPRQIANRNKEKAERVEKLRHSMKDLRKQVHDDLDAEDDKTRLTALAIALIDATFERVGNDDSADEGHFGVTGWLKKHLTFGKGKATIKYVGKSGVKHEKVVDDAKLVKALKGCCEDKSPDDPILSFGSEDADGPVKITSRDVNAYLKPFDVTAKDLRGFHANREMQEQLRSLRKKGPDLPKGRKEKDKILKDEFKKALEATAEAVGHEAATLRTQYLVPGLEDAYMKDGTVIDNLKDASVERVASAWLHRVATKTQGEREDEEAERLVRQSPSKKPPRDDSKRERMNMQDDPDVGAKDKDLSRNYKDTGG